MQSNYVNPTEAEPNENMPANAYKSANPERCYQPNVTACRVPTIQAKAAAEEDESPDIVFAQCMMRISVVEKLRTLCTSLDSMIQRPTPLIGMRYGSW
jgi:hypothetical protein